MMGKRTGAKHPVAEWGRTPMPDVKVGQFRGNRNLERLSRITQKKQEEEIKRGLR